VNKILIYLLCLFCAFDCFSQSSIESSETALDTALVYAKNGLDTTLFLLQEIDETEVSESSILS